MTWPKVTVIMPEALKKPEPVRVTCWPGWPEFGFTDTRSGVFPFGGSVVELVDGTVVLAGLMVDGGLIVPMVAGGWLPVGALVATAVEPGGEVVVGESGGTERDVVE